MSPRNLKIALAVSVALNVFAIAGGATAALLMNRVEKRVEAQHRPGREEPFRDIVGSLDPEVRDRVRSTLRASALAARPDFEAARTARREAIALSEGPTLDQDAVAALLEQSRQSEMKGRARLESDSVALLSTLEPDDRKALAVLLNRQGRGGRDRGGPGRGQDRPGLAWSDAAGTRSLPPPQP